MDARYWYVTSYAAGELAANRSESVFEPAITLWPTHPLGTIVEGIEASRCKLIDHLEDFGVIDHLQNRYFFRGQISK
jgi:hypothetical protein